MFIFFGILPRIHKSHAAEPNGSADPRLGTPALNETNNPIIPWMVHGRARGTQN
jgi:hypothetical protein